MGRRGVGALLFFPLHNGTRAHTFQRHHPKFSVSPPVRSGGEKQHLIYLLFKSRFPKAAQNPWASSATFCLGPILDWSSLIAFHLLQRWQDLSSAIERKRPLPAATPDPARTGSLKERRRRRRQGETAGVCPFQPGVSPLGKAVSPTRALTQSRKETLRTGEILAQERRACGEGQQREHGDGGVEGEGETLSGFLPGGARRLDAPGAQLSSEGPRMLREGALTRDSCSGESHKLRR